MTCLIFTTSKNCWVTAAVFSASYYSAGYLSSHLSSVNRGGSADCDCSTRWGVGAWSSSWVSTLSLCPGPWTNLYSRNSSLHRCWGADGAVACHWLCAGVHLRLLGGVEAGWPFGQPGLLSSSVVCFPPSVIHSGTDLGVKRRQI
jgi:hypothetical protein